MYILGVILTASEEARKWCDIHSLCSLALQYSKVSNCLLSATTSTACDRADGKETFKIRSGGICYGCRHASRRWGSDGHGVLYLRYTSV